MTTTLRVIVDDVLEGDRGAARYAEELTRALIETAPHDCEVSGVLTSRSDAERDIVAARLPGLASLHSTSLARRELQLAWQHGITRLPGKGMVHAPGLLAPLSRHDRAKDPGHQIAVTVQDATPLTRPELVPARKASWVRGMVKRAHRYADAVVVPTHAVGEGLSDFLDFGDRIRVIEAAVSSKLLLPVDSRDRAQRFALPGRYVLAVGGNGRQLGLEPLIRSLASGADAHLLLVVVGPVDADEVDVASLAAEWNVGDRVTYLGPVSDPDLAVLLRQATVVVHAAVSDGMALPVLEAMSLGTPVVHSDAPAVVELAADAGLMVEREDAGGYPDRLAAAISSVASDHSLAERLRYAGLDRAAAFTWRDSAQKVWQLHADL